MTAPSWGEERTKTVAWHDPMITAEAATRLSGLEFLRAIRDGMLPPPPIAMLMGFTMREVEPGVRLIMITGNLPEGPPWKARVDETEQGGEE